MPRGKKSGRAASGDGSIRKKIVKKNGKEYTYSPLHVLPEGTELVYYGEEENNALYVDVTNGGEIIWP